MIDGIEVFSPAGLLIIGMLVVIFGLIVNNMMLVDQINNRNDAFRWLFDHVTIAPAVRSKLEHIAKYGDHHVE